MLEDFQNPFLSRDNAERPKKIHQLCYHERFVLTTSVYWLLLTESINILAGDALE